MSQFDASDSEATSSAPTGGESTPAQVLKDLGLNKLKRQATDAHEALTELAKLVRKLDQHAFAVAPAAKAALTSLQAVQQSAESIDAARAWIEEQAQAAKRKSERMQARLAGGLARALEPHGLRVQGQLPELRVGPLTVEVGFDSGRARIWYGPRLEELGRAALTPEAIAEAIQVARAQLTEHFVDADTTLQRLLRAHQSAGLRAHGSAAPPPSEPLPIHAVWVEMVWWQQADAFGSGPKKSAFRDYSLAQFSHDLSSLDTRRTGGHELKLAVATREQTRKRGQTLWVPRGQRGEGTHYAAVSFASVAP